MYIPECFGVDEKEEMYRFVADNAFGQIISTVNGRLFSTHMPFLLSADNDKVCGHFAKSNPQHRSLHEADVLITFQGPHEYISPSWYVSPGVPTWNYQAVHINGRAHTFTDVDKLKVLVGSLTEKYESNFQKPWRPDFNEAMLNGIVGVEVDISDIQCKYKLNQNRSKEDRVSVINQLECRGENFLSRAMRQSLESE